MDILVIHSLFEGVCLNYRNPDPRRGEPRVGSAPDVAFWVSAAGSAGSAGSGSVASEFREALKCWFLQ